MNGRQIDTMWLLNILLFSNLTKLRPRYLTKVGLTKQQLLFWKAFTFTEQK